MKMALSLALAVAILESAMALTAQEASLRGTIKDAVTGALAPCSVTIIDANGKTVVERESFKAGFRCNGQFNKRLPAGRTHIRVTRGFEILAVEKDIDLQPGQETEINFTLKRTVDLRKRGWYAGDSHDHMLHGERTIPVDFDFVALTARAEDLQYLCLAQDWVLEHPTPEALDAELEQRSTPDCRLTWNMEAPKNYYKGDAGRCLGHCWNVGTRGRTPEGTDVIHALQEASAWDYESTKPTYANFESHHLIHAQGGAVCYSHPARWWMGSWGGQGVYPKVERMRVSNMAVELPLDTLLGPTFDGIDVVTSPGETAANAKAFELWTMLLNHGYRLAATGSSDACFDRPGGAVPGTTRLYTYQENGFSFSAVARAIAAGHTFVTTGPLLLATVDGQPPGSAFPTGKDEHSLNIEAWRCGHQSAGLKRLEILRNGRPFKQWEFAGSPPSIQTNLPIQERETAWYCVRVFGADPQRQSALSGAFYFDQKPYEPPEAVRARVHVKLQDAKTGKPVPGSLIEVTYDGPIPRPGRRHGVQSGEATILMPGTKRLCAEAPGYEPLTLSPVLDCPELIKIITRMDDAELLNWQTFERLRERLGHVDLTFQLSANQASRGQGE